MNCTFTVVLNRVQYIGTYQGSCSKGGRAAHLLIGRLVIRPPATCQNIVSRNTEPHVAL